MAIESALPESDVGFRELRGVQWRLNLGILRLSSSVDHLRRVTADTRRRYAKIRRRLLVDLYKDGRSSPDLAIDNPLSQNPGKVYVSLEGRICRAVDEGGQSGQQHRP